MPTRTIMTSVAAAVAALTAALGGCGASATSPPGSLASSQSVAQSHNQADIAFAQGMIPHHAQAIVMSRMAAQRAGSQVKDLAARIQAAQQPEIDQMSGWLHAWNAPVPSTDSPIRGMGQMDHRSSGLMPGMMSGGKMQQFAQATGVAFDRMFLQMMLIHHQGAVTMAKGELSEGQYSDARQLAQRVIDAHQREITEMQTLLGG
jgi:uncharacterized protein (DUF305 family)